MKTHQERKAKRSISFVTALLIFCCPFVCRSVDTTEAETSEVTIDIDNNQMKLRASRNNRTGEEQYQLISSNMITTVSKNSAEVSVIGNEGILEYKLPKCTRDSIKLKGCSRNEFLPQFQNLEEILFDHTNLDSNGKSYLKCNPALSIQDYKSSFLDPTKKMPGLEAYFKDNLSCKDFPNADVVLAQAILKTKAEFSDDFREREMETPATLTQSKKNLSEILLFLKYMESPNSNLKPFQLVCRKDGINSPVDFSTKPPTLTMSSQLSLPASQISAIAKSFILSRSGNDRAITKESLEIEATKIVGLPGATETSRTTMAADSTSSITASGTQAIPTAPHVSVAQLVEAVKTNRPESQGVIQAFAQQAVREAREVVQQIPQESFKAIGGSSASFLAASQRALAGDSRVVVVNNPTKPAATSPTAATNPKPPTSPVAPKINIGASVTAAAARTMASVADDDDVEVRDAGGTPASGKAGARGPASAATSMRGKASSDAGRANLGSSVDGVSFSGGGGGAGSSDPQGLQKKVSPSNSITSTNPLVRDLMNKEKSKEIVKSLKSADKAKKEEIEKRCKAGDARIFDKKNNILCQGKSTNPAIFREADDGSLIRLK